MRVREPLGRRLDRDDLLQQGDAATEQIALVKGRIDPDQPTLVRMHVLSPFVDLFGEAGERSAPAVSARWR
jgi:GTP cyclohydrolase II